MLGDRHHVIPKFLLKGFVSRAKGKQLYTNVYLKNKIYESNIVNVGVDKDFYIQKNNLNADDAITSFENKYAKIISVARTLKDQEKIEDIGIADLISHLWVRTKNLRDLLFHSSDYLIDQFTKYISDFDQLNKLIDNNLSYIKKQMISYLDSYPISELQKELLLEMAVSEFLPNYLESQRVFLPTQIKTLTDEIRVKIFDEIKKVHLDILTNQPSPQVRAEKYRMLNWFLVEVDFPLIIGDACCLFKTRGSKNLKSFEDKDDITETIFLPISFNQVIVGTIKDKFEDKAQLQDLNREVARCSHCFFVASVKSDDFVFLTQLLGNELESFFKKEIEKMVSNYFLQEINISI